MEYVFSVKSRRNVLPRFNLEDFLRFFFPLKVYTFTFESVVHLKLILCVKSVT